MKLKPKSFGPVFALPDGAGGVRYAYRDPEQATAQVPTQTPVDTMLASLAACIVKSVEWAAAQQGASINPFLVRVTAQKALNDPPRVEEIQVTIIGAIVDHTEPAAAILEHAKAICTVSNTLNCTITMNTEA